MAFDLERGSVFRPWVLLIMLALIQVVSAQFCSFWNTDCIDTLAQTAVSFDFQPLFPDPVYLYYGFDARSSRRIKSPITKTGFWLRYQNHVNRATVDANRTSEIGLRVGNLAGMPSGNNNGCDGIWGPTCSADFKSALRHNMYRIAVSGTYYSKPLKRALSQMLLNPPQLPSCPPTILDVASIPVQDFAEEQILDHHVTLMNPGSGRFPWQVWYLDGMTSHQQASQVAVGIVSRGPTYNTPSLSPDDIQVELVCLRSP